MSWLQVSLPAAAAQVDAVIAALEALGAVAVTTRPHAGAAVLEPAPGEQPLGRDNLVTGLFDGTADADAIRARLMRALDGVVSVSPVLAVLEDAHWEQAWRQQAVARCFGAGLWVLPFDAPRPAEARAVVRLDPGLAFGTGAHATTALCLQWLAGLDLAQRTVIDFGCGSGILAIAAAVLGAHCVYACDHDPQALAATGDNALRNGVADRVFITDDPPAADILVANILANALDELAPRFAALVHVDGRIALSGILPPQSAQLTARYASSFRMQPPREDQGWVLLAGKRLAR